MVDERGRERILLGDVQCTRLSDRKLGWVGSLVSHRRIPAYLTSGAGRVVSMPPRLKSSSNEGHYMTTTAKPLKVGLSLRHTLQANPLALAELARVCDAVGLDSLWLPHHTIIPTDYASRYPYQKDSKLPFPADTLYSDSLTLLSYVAAVTTHVRLGTNVIPLITQHPLALAKQAATVDHLSGGRLELGLGSGWLTEEGTVLGQPTNKRARRLSETIDILRKAWTGQPFTHEGEFWQFPELVCSPAAAQGSDIPIWLGGSSPAVVEIIRTRGSGAILPPGDAGEEILAQLRPLLPADRDIISPMVVSPDSSDDDILRSLESWHRRGVAGVILLSPPDTDIAIPLMRRIGEHVLPRLAR
ncbi:LLM class F420-dependent oxidoreductase [Rhodococcus sp. ACPA1]|nr:LLM class F420-dependent oxidoreductase [Rhodococcus sp. ACPA1]